MQTDSLVADLTDLWNLLPPAFRTCLEKGDAVPAVEPISQSCSSFWFGFNRITTLFSIPLLRLEPFNSFGLEVASKDGSTTLCDVLGDEFASPGYDLMLRDAVLFTRLLESRIKLNPNLEKNVSAGTIIFRVFCLHVATLRKLRQLYAFLSRDPTAQRNLVGIIEEAEHDSEICLDILQRFARRGAWMLPQYKLARKLMQGEKIAELEVAMARARVDIVLDDNDGGAEGGMPVADTFRSDLGRLIGVYQPARA